MDFNTINLLMTCAKEYSHARIREAGISDTGHRICAFLYFHSGAYQDMIASSLMLDKTTVAKSLSALEERGLITRVQDPENRRKNILAITDAGKETIADIAHIYDEWLNEVESCLSPDERTLFHGFCARLLESAKKTAGNRREQKGKIDP